MSVFQSLSATVMESTTFSGRLANLDSFDGCWKSACHRQTELESFSAFSTPHRDHVQRGTQCSRALSPSPVQTSPPPFFVWSDPCVCFHVGRARSLCSAFAKLLRRRDRSWIRNSRRYPFSPCEVLYIPRSLPSTSKRSAVKAATVSGWRGFGSFCRAPSTVDLFSLGLSSFLGFFGLACISWNRVSKSVKRSTPCTFSQRSLHDSLQSISRLQCTRSTFILWISKKRVCPERKAAVHIFTSDVGLFFFLPAV